MLAYLPNNSQRDRQDRTNDGDDDAHAHGLLAIFLAIQERPDDDHQHSKHHHDDRKHWAFDAQN